MLWPLDLSPCEEMRLNSSQGLWAGRSPAQVPRSGAGGAPPPQRFLRSCWVGEGLWAYQEGQMGQKMGCFGGLRGTRSRQDESKEVHEAGRIRPSLGCNGVHVLSLYPLIWRSLCIGRSPRQCVYCTGLRAEGGQGVLGAGGWVC